MNVAECGVVVLISDNMKVTIIPTGKHEGFSWMAGGAVTVGSMVYNAHVTFEVANSLVLLFTDIHLKIGGFRLNMRFNKESRNVKFYRRHTCFEE